MTEFFKQIGRNLFHKLAADNSYATPGRMFKSIIRYLPEEDQIFDYVNYIIYNNVIITDKQGDDISFTFLDGIIVFFDDGLPPQPFRGGVRTYVDSSYCMFNEL